MAFRFKLTNDGTAPGASPTLQSYTHSTPTTIRRQLKPSDTSTLTTTAYAPDGSDDLNAGDALWCQFVSEGMAAGITFANGQTIKMAMQCLEANQNNNAFLQLFVSVVSNDGATVRRTLRTKVLDGTEMNTTIQNRFLSTTQDGADYTTVEGDRLCVELSLQGDAVASGGVQGHNGSMRFGGSGSSGDLPENDTEAGATFNPWIEFAPSDLFTRTIAVGGGFTPAGALANSKLAGLSVSGSITPTGTLLQRVNQFLGGGFTPAGVLINEARQFLSGSISPTGLLVNLADKLFGGSITPSGSLDNVKEGGSFTIELGGGITPTGTLTQAASQLLSGGVTPTGAIVRQAQKVLGGSITPTGTLTILKVAVISVGGAITPVGTLINQAAKQLVGSITPSGALTERIDKLLVGTITPTGSLGNLKVAVLSLGGAIAPVGNLINQATIRLFGTLTMTGQLTEKVTKYLSGAVTPTGLVTLRVARAILISGIIAPIGALITTKITATVTKIIQPFGKTHRDGNATQDGFGRTEKKW